MTLTEACEQFLRLNIRIRDPRTACHYRDTVAMFSRHLGRTATTADLTDDAIHLWMVEIVRRGCSAATANHRRKNLVALWNWLAKRKLVETWPTVPRLPEPQRVPRAWTEDQIRRLIEACAKMPGTMNGYVPASDWWLAFHGVAWDTGARTSEILSLRWSWLDKLTGVLHVPAEARKGKRKDALYQLMPDTLAAVAKLDQGALAIFQGIGHRSAFWKRYARVLRLAGLPVGRSSQPQKMRRSHASWLKVSGGDPTSSLGHSSDAVTRASYLDPSICSPPPAQSLFRILPREDAG